MSIAGDLLTAATPTRLVCRRGAWMLEIERLVAVERNVYQPRTQRIEGTEAIVQHLQRTVHGVTLANAASTLLRSLHAEECSFEAVEGEWIACEPSARAESGRPSVSVAANAAAAELRAELCLLRATHAGLRARVATLEAQLWSRAEAREPARPRLSVPAPAPTPRPAPRRASEPAPEGPPELVPESAPEPSAAVPVPKLKLPTAPAVSSCLNTLIGRKIESKELRPVPFPGKGKSPCWFCRLLDDEGNDVGVIVADLLAVVGLGGALMMVPPTELEAQRTAKLPSEDVMSAMAEVANNLSATINQQAETLHVRVGPLEAMTGGSLDWVKKAALGLGLELAAGMGQLFLFGR
jgi:hypothetical protein